MDPLEIYLDKVHETGKSVFGNTDRMTHYQDLLTGPEILKSFWNDNDIQEITIVSTNIGMVKTFTKSYRK